MPEMGDMTNLTLSDFTTFEQYKNISPQRRKDAKKTENYKQVTTDKHG
jgi:hypothetical protein